MPRSPSRDALAYAERICGRLPGRLKQLRKAAGLSQYALARHSGVTRVMIARIEDAKSIPTLFVAARLAAGLSMTLRELVGQLDGRAGRRG